MSASQPKLKGILFDLLTTVQLVLGVLLPIAFIGWVYMILDTYCSPDPVRLFPLVPLVLIGGIVLTFLLGTPYD
ncbi:hypothetical protein [Natrinema caseinilyticum]|uniref:hypothetical protein n=1 Tax=Natrinema caseinilyticum TaxID=2961570 RepID=UPI0020C440D9|nr:hypothetical protein [Natrinema caseinilyticum]